MRTLLVLLVSVQSLLAYLPYDENRRVPFANAPGTYSRDEYDWWQVNTGQPSRLFMAGVYQSEETGTFDLQMDAVWALRPDANNITVGIIDVDPQHMARVGNLVSATAPGCVLVQFPVDRFYGDVFATALSNAAQVCRIIVVPTGWATSDPQLSNAFRHVYTMNRVVVCAVPNQPQDIESTPDYPTSWYFPNVLSVAACDRNGEHYWSATGATVVDAPGRNITSRNHLGELVYGSGTSSASGIVAGCVALYMKQRPKMNANGYVQRVLTTADVVNGQKRINPLWMLTKPMM